MRIVIKQIKTYSNQFRVWGEGGTVGPMIAEMGAKRCNSPEEVFEEVRRLLLQIPRFSPEVEEKVDEAERALTGKQ